MSLFAIVEPTYPLIADVLGSHQLDFLVSKTPQLELHSFGLIDTNILEEIINEALWTIGVQPAVQDGYECGPTQNHTFT